ncbi:hypothetical protein AAVH_05475 [Aphelenchoides avenae]|nr:hypothetical protein AAVH_05475 [Aphelenchus avenae]
MGDRARSTSSGGSNPVNPRTTLAELRVMLRAFFGDPEVNVNAQTTQLRNLFDRLHPNVGVTESRFLRYHKEARSGGYATDESSLRRRNAPAGITALHAHNAYAQGHIQLFTASTYQTINLGPQTATSAYFPSPEGDRSAHTSPSGYNAATTPGGTNTGGSGGGGYARED